MLTWLRRALTTPLCSIYHNMDWNMCQAQKFRYICVTKTNFRQLQRFIWLNLYHMAEQFFCKIVADLQT